VGVGKLFQNVVSAAFVSLLKYLVGESSGNIVKRSTF